jgi:PIN domain nuclease of toxin-antitoxin system
LSWHSPVSCYEIALAHDKGRIILPATAQDWLHQDLIPAGIDLFPLNETISARAVQLSPVHRDPFDRMIIATALEYDAKLASVDSLFPQYAELANHLMS